MVNRAWLLKITLLLLLANISYEQLVLARMIETEGFHDATGQEQEAANALIDTVYNRIDLGWCDNVSDCMSAYHGYTIYIPSSKAINAVKSYHRGSKDIVFAYNEADCATVGRNPNDADITIGPFFFFRNEK